VIASSSLAKYRSRIALSSIICSSWISKGPFINIRQRIKKIISWKIEIAKNKSGAALNWVAPPEIVFTDAR
jgi:hypothetical protein